MTASTRDELWSLVLEEAWSAYLCGSVPVGAVIVSRRGEVLARGRNRTAEPRAVQGFIAGNDLAHAEINALLALSDTARPGVYEHTLYTSLEPCPQCLGALVMSGVRGLVYAAPDPWAGCAELLETHRYMSRKGLTVSRAPAWVGEVSALLQLVWSLENGHSPDSPFVREFAGHSQERIDAAYTVHASGLLRRLRVTAAPFEEAWSLLSKGCAGAPGEPRPA